MPIEHPPLRTQRLIVQPLAIDHASALLAYYERNRDYLKAWEPTRSEAFYSEPYQCAAISQAVAETATGTGVRYVACEPGSDAIVANVNLSNLRRGVIHCAIVSYSVDGAHAGRGYASELLAAVVRYAFETLGLHRLEASYQPENRASGRVLAKNGFVVEGYARDYLFLDGAWRDGVLASLTNAAWRP